MFNNGLIMAFHNTLGVVGGCGVRGKPIMSAVSLPWGGFGLLWWKGEKKQNNLAFQEKCTLDPRYWIVPVLVIII